jgi:hypothetical protein
MFANWFAGVVLVYSMLFGIGSLIFGDYLYAFIYLLTASGGILVISINFAGDRAKKVLT